MRRGISIRKAVAATMVILLGGVLLAQDEAALRQRVRARAELIADLVASSVVKECPYGLLRPDDGLTPEQERFVQAENEDRRAVFALIAERTSVPFDEVARMYSARAAKAAGPGRKIWFGSCGLTPAKDADVSRLLEYLKQGMNYASQRKFDLALAEFQPALTIDKNFLGLQQNIGSAHLARKHYEEAQSAFEQELKLITCLSELTNADLALFGYFMEVQEKDPVKQRIAQATNLRAELPKMKAAVHYNLACLYSVRRDKEGALAGLQAALDAGFSDKKALASDPDLAFVRSLPEYRHLVAGLM